MNLSRQQTPGRTRIDARIERVRSSTDPPGDPLQRLSTDELAIVSLLLTQGHGYTKAAELLSLDRDATRARAHLTLGSLAGLGTVQADAPVAAEIIDYLLGEQSDDERARTELRLETGSLPASTAVALADALGSLAARSLRPLPGATLLADRRPVRTRSTPDTLTPPAGSGRPAHRRARAAPPPAPLTFDGTAIDVKSRVGHEPIEVWPWLVGSALATTLLAALLLVILLGGSDKSGSHRSPSQPASIERGASAAAQTIRRLILRPVATARETVASGAVVRQPHGLLLLLNGRGMPPNNGDSYGVWLSNGGVDSQLLGFISPNVGAAGTFATGTMLPPDAVRFRGLLITRETRQSPARPGPVVLHGELSLPPDA